MITCGECGAQNESDAQFCVQCDAYLVWEEPRSDRPPGDRPPPDRPPTAVEPEIGVADALSSPPRTPKAAQRPSRPERLRQPASEGPEPAERGGATGDPTVASRATPEEAVITDGHGGSTVGAVTPSEKKGRPHPSYAPERARPQVRRQVDQEVSRRAHQVVGGTAGAAAQGTPAVRPTVLGRSVADTSARRRFDRAMSAAAGRRVPYNRPLRTRVVVTRIVLGALVGLGLLVGLSPLGSSLASFVGDQVARVVPGMYRIVEADAALPTPGSAEGFNAFRAIDGFVDTAWSVPITPNDEAMGTACSDASPGATGTLALSFSEPTRVDRVTILPGVHPDLQGSADHGAPRVVDLVFLGEDPAAGPIGCERQELDPAFAPQDAFVGGITDVRTVRVHIRQAFLAETASSDLVATSEVVFAAR